MKQKPALLVIAALCAALVGGCTTGSQPGAASSDQTQQAVKLADRSWDGFNKAQIEKFLATYGKGGPNYNPAKPPYAVFDWDNTMVFLDVEEATFILILAYDKLGMTDLRDDADRVMRKNFPDSEFYKTGLVDKKKWWHLW